MKLFELFLKETSEEERAIVSLAAAISSRLLPYADDDQSDTSPEDDYDDFEDMSAVSDDRPLLVGQIGELFNTPLSVLDDVKIELRSDYSMRLLIKNEKGKIEGPDKVQYLGLWNPDLNLISLNRDYIGTKTFRSYIAHELRHALDDKKSDYQASRSTRYNQARRPDYRKITNDPHMGNLSYLAQPAEINARFTQVLAMLSNNLPALVRANPGKEQEVAMKELSRAMNKHNISYLFPEKEKSKDYKRLVKRAVDYIDKEISYLKSKKSLNESVTFGVARLKSDKKHGEVYSMADFEQQQEEECWFCDGSGKNSYYGDDCERCKGLGKTKEWRPVYQGLNVSNSNAVAILDMLGVSVSQDLSGVWKNEDLPEIRRRLIRLKNKDLKLHTQEPSQSQGPARRVKDDDGMDRITRGPTIIDYGRSIEQVERYIDRLLSIIDFAQKNQAVVIWS